MADTRTLRRPAVAGHARAVVKYVGHFELHVYVTSGLPDPCPSRAKRKVDRLGLFYNLFLREPRQITRDCDEVHGDSRLRGTVGSGEEAPQTDCRFLCPKLCETALDDSYRGGIPRGSRTFGPRLNDLSRLSRRFAEAPRTCMTSLTARSRPIATLAAPRRDARTRDDVAFGWARVLHGVLLIDSDIISV